MSNMDLLEACGVRERTIFIAHFKVFDHHPEKLSACDVAVKLLPLLDFGCS